MWAQHDGGAADKLLIGVSDEGPGIPEREQDRLFEKLPRARSVSGRRSGSGFYPHPTLSLAGGGL